MKKILLVAIAPLLLASVALADSGKKVIDDDNFYTVLRNRSTTHLHQVVVNKQPVMAPKAANITDDNLYLYHPHKDMLWAANLKVETAPIALEDVAITAELTEPTLLDPGDVVSSVSAATHFVVTPRKKKPFLIRMAITGGLCGLGIGLAGNPATAAEIGLPIFFGGQYLAWRLYQKHPKLSEIIQGASVTGCFAAGRGAKPHVGSKSVTNTNPSHGTTGTTTHGSTPPGSNPPPGGGNPPPGGGNPPPGGGGTPPPTHGGPCLTDCGFPGNGGLNGGADNAFKPPFPGKGPVKF